MNVERKIADATNDRKPFRGIRIPIQITKPIAGATASAADFFVPIDDLLYRK